MRDVPRLGVADTLLGIILLVRLSRRVPIRRSCCRLLPIVPLTMRESARLQAI